jgi:hypothetical protein
MIPPPGRSPLGALSMAIMASIETRIATISTAIDWLLKEDHQWPGLKAIGKVVRTRETRSKTTIETAYYLLSTAMTAERFARSSARIGASRTDCSGCSI